MESKVMVFGIASLLVIGLASSTINIRDSDGLKLHNSNLMMGGNEINNASLVKTDNLKTDSFSIQATQEGLFEAANFSDSTHHSCTGSGCNPGDGNVSLSEITSAFGETIRDTDPSWYNGGIPELVGVFLLALKNDGNYSYSVDGPSKAPILYKDRNTITLAAGKIKAGSVSNKNTMEVEGNVDITGDIDVSGDVSSRVKNFVHKINDTHEAVYTSQESPDPRAVVEGTARLENGEASVELPNHFTKVTSDTQPEIKVQATPLSTDTYGIAVTKKGTDELRFEELMNGDSDIRFDYRVTAIRDGYEDQKVVQEK